MVNGAVQHRESATHILGDLSRVCALGHREPDPYLHLHTIVLRTAPFSPLIMRRSISTALAASLCSLALGQSPTATYPDPRPCIGPACANPSSQLDYQDFTVIRRASDSTYFRYSKSNTTGLGMSVATAPASSGPWYYAFEILDGPLFSPIASNRSDVDLWAPEAHYINGQYYLYYGAHTQSFQFDICVATSPNMSQGTWTDHGSMNVPTPPLQVPIPSAKPRPEYTRLGNSLMAPSSNPQGYTVDVWERRYMIFDSDLFGLYGFPVSTDFLSIEAGANVSEIIVDQNSTKQSNMNRTAASYVLTHDDYIYLFYDVGDCCAPEDTPYDDLAHVEVCRAFGSATGPYSDRNGENCMTGGVDRIGTTVLAGDKSKQVFAPGSIGVVNDPEEGLCMFYQVCQLVESSYVGRQLTQPQYKNFTAGPGLRFGYNYLEFSWDGWPVLVASRN